MGKHGRIVVCNFLFWTKAVVALLVSTGGLAFLAYKVYDLNQYARAHPPVPYNPWDPANWNGQGNAPIVIPPANPTGTGGSTGGASSCFATQSSFSRVEPPVNKIMLGFHLDWAKDTPSKISNRLNGLVPAAITVNWFGSEVGKIGGILELTLEPVTTLDQLTDDILDAIARQCYDINTRYGTPILLRFAHEMNGDWTVYGYKPTAYKAGFQRMSTFIRKYTNMTAMVWGPNIGTAYPFNPSSYQSLPPKLGQTDFDVLDTNHDGVLDMWDDPYGPYYPGDEYVDWVALSLYYYPISPEDNHAVEPTYFKDNMNGIGPVIDEIVSGANQTFADLHNFYKRFAAAKNKPMMLPETGAPFYTEIPANAGELAIKQAWWSQVFSADTLTNYPLLKLVVNFEEAKQVGSHVKDWTVTVNNATLGPYIQYIDGFRSNLLLGTDIKFSCSGQISLK